MTPRAQAQVLRGNHFGYVIDRVLGDGAWSRVYQVLEPRTSRVLALKHVVSASEREARYLQQAEMEWEVSRRVKSPVIRNILHRASRQTTVGTDVVQELALVMEMIDAQSLEDQARPSLANLCRIFLDTAMALEDVANAGYVHADMKPNNILFTDDGRTRIIDFGQAVKRGTVKPRMSGTPGYVAPEQPRCEAITDRTDVFNLGATMYRLLTSQFAPQTVHSNYPAAYANPGAMGTATGSRTLVSASREPIPPALSLLVFQCLELAPSARPPMARVAEQLRAIQLPAVYRAPASSLP